MTKKYLTTHAKEHKQQQHCPICNRYKKYSERYPEYVCEKCTRLATDKTGTSIGFYNITHDGHGCQGRYVESGKLYRGTTCYVKGIKCYADEAYLGGIVIRPIGSRKSKFEEPIIVEA